MKETIVAGIGAVGSYILWLVGGWDYTLMCLLIFMGLDYLTGLIVAGIFHKSNKTENGNLDSHIGWKGLVKKIFTLSLVIVANLLDGQIGGGSVIRDAVCITFMTNELLSIVENAGLMGIPIPKVIKAAISSLNGEAEKKDSSATAKIEEVSATKEETPETKIEENKQW